MGYVGCMWVVDFAFKHTIYLKCFAIIFTKVHINLVDSKTRLSLMSSVDFPNTHITRVDTMVSMTTKIIE